MSGDNNKDRKEETNYPGDELELGDKLSPEVRKGIEAAFMSMESISRPLLSPLESKINEKHIDKILEIKEKYGDNVFKDTQQSRKFQLVYVLIGVSVFVFLTLLLVGKDTDLFKEIIKLFVTFVGGIGVGFGIKSHINSK